MLALNLPGHLIVHEGRGPARQPAIIRSAIKTGPRAASGRERTDAAMFRRKLVVADESHTARIEPEGSHAIGMIWHAQAVVHRIAQGRNDAVGEATRQIEELARVSLQRAISRSGR